MTEAQIEARRKGGLSTLARHGVQFYSDLGKKYGSLGGRPRSLNIDELRALLVDSNKK
jgi:hypothetical protein